MSTTRYRRFRKKREFVQVDNAVVQNGALSYRARGVLAYVMSLPDEAAMDSVSIASACSAEGRDAVRGAIKELEHAGHYWRRKVRIDGGRVVTDIAYTEESICPWDDDGITPIRLVPPLHDQAPRPSPEPEIPSPADDSTGAWDSVPGPAPGNPSPVEAPPAPDNPAPGNPDAGESGVKRKDESKHGCKNEDLTLFAAFGLDEPPADTTPPKGGRVDFEEIWQRWPARNGRRVGKAAAVRSWHGMTATEQAKALDALPRYKRWLEASGTDPRDLHRWLGSERGTNYADFEADAELPASRPALRNGAVLPEKTMDLDERTATATRLGIEVVNVFENNRGGVSA